MYIRRKVFSSVIDEETGEERLFSATEFMNEEDYLMQRAYAEEAEDKKDKKKKQVRVLRVGDKVGLWASKHLNSKKDREALIEAYDEEGPRNSHKLGKQSAKYGALGGGIVGAAGGALLGKGNPVGALAGAAGGAALGAGSGYVNARLGAVLLRNIDDRLSTNSARRTKLAVDRHKVASGIMSKDEYREKHGRLVREDD